MSTFYRDTDPYGHLNFAIGNGDDFVCFDYEISDDLRTFRLHAVINSETGGFIQNAADPVEVPLADAPAAAQVLVDQAIDWLAGDGWSDPVEHDVEGWNQDPQYFVRCVTESALRIAENRVANSVDVPRIVTEEN